MVALEALTLAEVGISFKLLNGLYITTLARMELVLLFLTLIFFLLKLTLIMLFLALSTANIFVKVTDCLSS